MQYRQSCAPGEGRENHNRPVCNLASDSEQPNPAGLFVSNSPERTGDGPSRTQRNSPDVLSHTINNHLQRILDHASQIFLAVTEARIRIHCAEIETAVVRVGSMIQALAQSEHNQDAGSKRQM